MMGAGTERSEVPLSMRALQPFSQPRKTLSLDVLSSRHRSGTVMLLSGLCRTCHVVSCGGLASPVLSTRGLGNVSLASLICTVQVCLPTTGTRTKLWGFTTWIVSFQTKNPSDPGCLPRHTENDFELKVSSMVRLPSICSAMVDFVDALVVSAFDGTYPLCRRSDTLWIAALALFQASEAGVSGGPRPTTHWKAALKRMGILASDTSQKLWFGI
mmetsp:Transcript_30998/g.88873  ORF Transcript_30998/g.88873 Transcript_30998/m.88873 type:complete len:214 (+) Transcript_30998:540-1181(+)